VFNLGITEIALILAVALIFLGPKMLPEIATGLGKAIREIRKTTAGIRQDIELDDAIRGPLRELREAVTLPPEELKRRDEAKAARQKAEQEGAERRRLEATAAAEAEQQRQKAEAAEQARQREVEAQATQISMAPPLAVPSEVIGAGGTLIGSPPPAGQDLKDLQTLTPVPVLPSPSPSPRLPPPPPPPPKAEAPTEATVIDLQAQLKATLGAKTTLPGRPAPAPLKPPLYRPRGDKKE
jgi:TatA/E family protein of Tat protein translocase